MSRWLRALLPVGLILALVPLVADSLDAQPAPTAGACRTTNVLLLIDQSQSLQDTDPGNLRVAGAEALVRSLSNSADASGETVNLAIAGFGEGAAIDTTVTLPKQVDEAKAAVDAFAGRNTDQNTDYVLALRLALEHFAALPGVPPSCNKVVWFTDGAYSIDKTDAVGLSEYTSSRDKGTIQAQLGDQICGPLPDGSSQDRPVSEAIRAAGFSVQMIDLRVEGAEKPQDRVERNQTAPVIERLLAGDPADTCRVAGGRVEAAAANELATEFFAQGQVALGHFPLDCSLLATGYPATMVNSLAVQNSDVDDRTEILLDGRVETSHEGFAVYSPSNGPAGRGLITARAANGQLKACFADLRATVASQGDAAVFGKAGTSYLNFKVSGSGETADGAGVGSGFVNLVATVDGTPATVRWDEPSRSWRVTIDGPRTNAPVVVASASAVGWSGAPFAPFKPVVDLRNEPPAPQVAWKGPTTIEGKTTVGGELVITPAALKTGGELCVSFDEPLARPETLTVAVSNRSICHSDDGPFSVPASLATASSSNGTGQVTLPFRTTYKPNGAVTDIPVGGTQEVVFPPITLVKPADGKRVALISAALLILSVLLSLGILVALTNRHLRLPDPANLRVVTVPLEIDDGVIRRAADSAVRPEDFGLIQGDRRKYLLPGGVELRGRRSFNPFTDLSAKAVSSVGSIGVVPALSRAVEPRVKIPASFEQLAVVSLASSGLTGSAILLAKKGTSLPVAERAIDDAVERVNTERSSASAAARRSAGSGSGSGSEVDEALSDLEPAGMSQAPAAPTRAGNPTAPPSVPAAPAAPTRIPSSPPTQGSVPPPPPSRPPAPPSRG